MLESELPDCELGFARLLKVIHGGELHAVIP